MQSTNTKTTSDNTLDNALDNAIDSWVESLFVIPSDAELIELINGSYPLIDVLPENTIDSPDFDFVQWLLGNGEYTFEDLERGL